MPRATFQSILEMRCGYACELTVARLQGGIARQGGTIEGVRFAAAPSSRLGSRMLNAYEVCNV